MPTHRTKPIFQTGDPVVMQSYSLVKEWGPARPSASAVQRINPESGEAMQTSPLCRLSLDVYRKVMEYLVAQQLDDVPAVFPVFARQQGPVAQIPSGVYALAMTCHCLRALTLEVCGVLNTRRQSLSPDAEYMCCGGEAYLLSDVAHAPEALYHRMKFSHVVVKKLDTVAEILDMITEDDWEDDTDDESSDAGVKESKPWGLVSLRALSCYSNVIHNGVSPWVLKLPEDTLEALQACSTLQQINFYLGPSFIPPPTLTSAVVMEEWKTRDYFDISSTYEDEDEDEDDLSDEEDDDEDSDGDDDTDSDTEGDEDSDEHSYSSNEDDVSPPPRARAPPKERDWEWLRPYTHMRALVIVFKECRPFSPPPLQFNHLVTLQVNGLSNYCGLQSTLVFMSWLTTACPHIADLSVNDFALSSHDGTQLVLPNLQRLTCRRLGYVAEPMLQCPKLQQLSVTGYEQVDLTGWSVPFLRCHSTCNHPYLLQLQLGRVKHLEVYDMAFICMVKTGAVRGETAPDIQRLWTSLESLSVIVATTVLDCLMPVKRFSFSLCLQLLVVIAACLGPSLRKVRIVYGSGLTAEAPASEERWSPWLMELMREVGEALPRLEALTVDNLHLYRQLVEGFDKLGRGGEVRVYWTEKVVSDHLELVHGKETGGCFKGAP